MAKKTDQDKVQDMSDGWVKGDGCSEIFSILLLAALILAHGLGWV